MRQGPIPRAAVVLLAMVAGVSCTSQTAEDGSGDAMPHTTDSATTGLPTTKEESLRLPAGASCPVTKTAVDYELPSVLRGTKGSWYGEGELWVAIPTFVANSANGSYQLKHPWVTLDEQGEFTSDYGPPTVHAQRLDAGGNSDGFSGGYAATPKGFEFWPTGIDFPSTGCWQIVGAYGESTVRFVVRVRK